MQKFIDSEQLSKILKDLYEDPEKGRLIVGEAKKVFDDGGLEKAPPFFVLQTLENDLYHRAKNTPKTDRTVSIEEALDKRSKDWMKSQRK